MEDPIRQPRTHLELVSDDTATPASSEPATTDPRSPRRPTRLAQAKRGSLRTAHRAKRTSMSLLFIPFFAIYVVVDAVRELSDWIARKRHQDLQRRPQFQRPATMPPLEERSMEDVVSVVESFPFRPVIGSAQATFFRDNGADAIGALLSPNPQVTTIPHMYPPPFQHRLFVGAEGERIAGMQAMHDHVGPAVVICHGLLMTKHFDVIIQMARRAFESWGFHVVTIDLRGWGQSAWTTEAPSSAGFHEGRDILEIARELHRDPRVTSVGAIGYSMGGSSVLGAAYQSSGSIDRPLDGGAVTVSAPTDIAMALRHISQKPHWRDPYFVLWNIFRAAIRGTVRQKNLDRSLSTWIDLVQATSIQHYGISMEEFCRQASAKEFAADIEMPVLALHSEDDFLVPVDHAELLADATKDNPWVHVMVRSAGAHVAFAAADPSWFHSTVRCWLEYWATPGVARAETSFRDFGEQLADEIG